MSSKEGGAWEHSTQQPGPSKLVGILKVKNVKVHLSDKDPINFMFKTFNVFIHVNLYIVCIYVYIMNDAVKSGFLQLQKKNSLVPQISY